MKKKQIKEKTWISNLNLIRKSLKVGDCHLCIEGTWVYLDRCSMPRNIMEYAHMFVSCGEHILASCIKQNARNWLRVYVSYLTLKLACTMHIQKNAEKKHYNMSEKNQIFDQKNLSESNQKTETKCHTETKCNTETKYKTNKMSHRNNL